MATVRLTNDLTRKIRTKLLEQKFDPIEAELKLMERRIAERLYEILYTQKDIETLAAAPTGWFSEDQNIGVRHQGQDHQFTFHAEHRFIYEHSYNNVHLNLDAMDEKRYVPGDVRTEVNAYLNKKTDLRETRATAIAQINGILSSCTTVKKLLEIWPEVRDVVEAVQAGSTLCDNLPMPMIGPLNDLLGLKKQAV